MDREDKFTNKSDALKWISQKSETRGIIRNQMQEHSETIAKLANTNSSTANDNLEGRINLIQKDLKE